MPSNCEIENVTSDDEIGWEKEICVSVINDESSSTTVTLECPSSTISPSSGHTVAAMTATEVKFTLTHTADHTDHDIKSKLNQGATTLHTDVVERVDVVQNPSFPGTVCIIIEGGVKRQPPPTLPEDTYEGPYTPTPGGNRVLVVVQRKLTLKTVFVKEAVLTVEHDHEHNRKLIHRWKVGLPTIQTNGWKLIVRAMLLDWKGKVLGTTTVGHT